MAKVLLT